MNPDLSGREGNLLGAAVLPVERAGPPELASVLASIDRRLAALEAAVVRVDEATSQAPAIVAAVGDAFDDHVARLRQQGIDVDARAADALRLLVRITSPGTVASLHALLDRLDAVAELLGAGALEPAPRDVLRRAARALADAATERNELVGAFGAVRAMGDHDVRRAIGFVVHVARGFGRGLASPPALTAATTNAGGGR